MATDLSTFYVIVEETTPVFKTRIDPSDGTVIINSEKQKQDIIKTVAHKDPGYDATYNKCTSEGAGCADYTQGFNYAPSCGECEKPLFPPFSDKKISCLAETLLKRLDFQYSIQGVIDPERSENYGGGMPIVDNKIETNRTDIYYSDAYIEYKLYNGENWTASSTSGWRNFPGANGEVSFNKFYAMSGFWLGFGPCHGANKLYQCAVSCESGEVVGCWQVGDLQREEGANPLRLYGEVRFGSVWGFKGLEAQYVSGIKYYQIYDPAQILAAGLKLDITNVIPLNPTLPINGYMVGVGSGLQPEETGFELCKPKRTSLDFGDAEYLRETNCLSGGDKRESDNRCSTCNKKSYKPKRAIDKMLSFADKNAPNYRNTALKDIPVSEFTKLKFTVIGDVVGKIFTDGNDCYFPKSLPDPNVGKFLLGGPTDSTSNLGYKQATFTDLGLAAGFYYDDCMSCLEEKANATYSLISVAKNEAARLNPFYNKSGIDVPNSEIHLKYNIDCNCVRCGDIYITGAPIFKSSTQWSITESWFSGHGTPEITNATLWKENLPQLRKKLAIIDNQLVYSVDPDCVPSRNPVPEQNPDFPYAKDRSPYCWDFNDSKYKRIWWFFDKSKKFTDLGFRWLVPMSSYWNWQPNGSSSTVLWTSHMFNANNLWNSCGGSKPEDRAVVPFCISCYEKLTNEVVPSTNQILTHSTLSVVTGVKLAAENEFTETEINFKGLPSVYSADSDDYKYGLPRSYLYYSRRASQSYYPCDNTTAGPDSFIGSSRCSCSPLPCMDEVMVATVPIKYWGDASSYNGVTGCNLLSPGTQAFPSVFEIHLEGTKEITTNPTTDKLYPLIGPNRYSNGEPFRTQYKVGLNWDSYQNSRLQAENSAEPGPAGAYKYQYSTVFLINNSLNSGYFQNFYVDHFDPLYFWNRPITFLNSGVIIKSNQVTPYNETLFKLARLHDAYHINCRNVGTATQPNWGEYGYKPNIPLSQTILCSMTAPAPNTTKTPYLQGPVVPNIVGPN